MQPRLCINLEDKAHAPPTRVIPFDSRESVEEAILTGVFRDDTACALQNLSDFRHASANHGVGVAKPCLRASRWQNIIRERCQRLLVVRRACEGSVLGCT
jgi:hypothetical protein